MTRVEITDVDSLIAAMKGLQIVGGGHDGPDGVHFTLAAESADTHYLVIVGTFQITGQFVVGLCRVQAETLQ